MSVEYDLPSIKLLLVDDDTFLTEVLTSQLLQEGIGEILPSANINDTKKLVPSFEPDILLLDVNLPDGSGIALCDFLRQTGFEKPIILLISKGSENDVINGLNAGANDYITKPVRLGELLALVRAQLRQFKSTDATRFTIGPLEFTPTNKMLSIGGKPERILLTEKETLVLKMLVLSFPTPVAKEVLLKEVWGFQSDLSTHTLETHIYRLRQKIKTLTEFTFIFTSENGYGLVGGS